MAATDTTTDNATNNKPAIKPKTIKLLKHHTHAGRDWEPDTFLPIASPDDPFSFDEEAAAWLVNIKVAEYA